MKKLLTILISISCAFMSANAAVLIIDDSGQLTGASGINVNDTLYDVIFEDGTCETLYNGCMDSDILFTDQATAEAAAQALLDQVLIDSFDANPELSAFCTNTINCLTRVVFQDGDLMNVSQAVVVNRMGNVEDSFFSETLSADNDSRIFSNVNFATFSVSEVPIPGALLFMVTGLIGLRVARK